MNTEPRRGLSKAHWPIFALAALAALLAGVAVFYVTSAPRAEPETERFVAFANGIDDVPIVAADGRSVRWAELNGKPRLVFFGFTRCPEVCPTTVAALSAAIEELGADARDVEVDFISVDPARDTPELLGLYFSNFGPRFHGFTGERANIDRLVQSFHASYEYVPTTGGDYTVNHTAITYLVNREGRVVDIIGYNAPHEQTVAQLRRFLR